MNNTQRLHFKESVLTAAIDELETAIQCKAVGDNGLQPVIDALCSYSYCHTKQNTHVDKVCDYYVKVAYNLLQLYVMYEVPAYSLHMISETLYAALVHVQDAISQQSDIITA